MLALCPATAEMVSAVGCVSIIPAGWQPDDQLTLSVVTCVSISETGLQFFSAVTVAVVVRFSVMFAF